MKKFASILKKRKTLTAIAVIVIILAAMGIIFGSALHKDNGEKASSKPGKTISAEKAEAKALEFVNRFLMESGSKAEIKDISSEYGLYKLSIDITSGVVESYISKDGRLFFPQALNIDEITAARDGSDTADSGDGETAATVSEKSDKPVVELFVMSYCPYGTQIEKGILPVIEALGNKIDFELKFCDYAMHGEKELSENLRQYCIQKEQPEKLNAYLECFLGDSEQADACLDKAGVNKSSLEKCTVKVDKEYKIMSNYTNKVGYQGSYPGFDVNKADNEKYSVGGSPTLIINGQNIQSNRDSASLLATICSAFNNQPEECSATLSDASPSAGFGYGTTTGSSDSGCQ